MPYSLRSFALFLAALSLAVLPIRPAAAQVRQLYVRGSLQHVHGVNLPWIVNGTSNYGHDLGPNQMTGYGWNYVGADVDRYFTDIKNMHTNVVRVWLFEGCEGLTFNASGYISGIDGTFMNNLRDMVTRANNHGLALYLTLFNFDIGNQFGHRTTSGYTVQNFFTNSTAQTNLINNCVRPLAQAFNGNPGVFGYDLMNESNYAVSPWSGAGFPSVSTWPQMHDWLYNLAGAIHGVASSLQVSCSTDDQSSFNSTNIWNRYGGIGLNFYDCHMYSNSPSVWKPGSGGPYPNINIPILLGEYGASTQFNWTTQSTVTDAFINQTSFQGWAGALAWSYDTSFSGGYALTYGVGSWHDAAWKIQWWGLNKFGL